MTLPEIVFADLHDAMGGRLFTVTVQDTLAGVARRAYTSHPVEYPTSVSKPLQQDVWSKQVLVEGKTFVANTTAEFANLFFDHALINALGCQSAVNIPVMIGGKVLGTINILDVEDHFTPSRLAGLQMVLADRLAEVATAMRAVPMGKAGPSEARLARLRVRMVETGTDLVALAPGAHLRWLLGFAPFADERPCFALIGLTEAGFLMPALNAADVRQHTDWPFWEWGDDAGPDAAMETALHALGRPRRVSLDETMRADHALMLLDGLPNVARGFAEDTVGYLRLRKDKAEIAALRENARIADLAQTALRAAVKPGVTEAALAEVAKAVFLAEGATCEFLIVGTGVNSAFPHHHTGSTVVKPGDAIVVDIGGRKDGYFSDITRMAVCGPLPDGYMDVHGVVDAAVRAALAAIRPGVRARDVDAAARGVIVSAGYGDYFTHRTGHGLGQEIHEPPYITGVSDVVLEAGMVFTIEPGIYLPGRFGIRLEEVAVVTDDGVEILSALSRAVFVA
ncbi:MAG: M24 family metallopeptidase [Paracoccaceae bacterium]